jgi:hypothetical protein
MINHRLYRGDLVWLLAYPLYQLLGTVRHEGSHALAVLLEGGRVIKFVFWPTWQDKFYFGYVRWAGQGLDWKVSFAPYFVDLLWFVAFYFVCTRVLFRRHWVWVNLFIIGLVSPLVDSLYRYVSSFFREGDLTSVYAAVPAWTVHAYFIITTVFYLVVLVLMQVRGDRAEVSK